MPMTNRVTEESSVVAAILPVSATGTYNSDVFEISAITTGRRFVADVQVGTIGASASITGGWQWNTVSSGGTWTAVTDAQITSDTAGSDIHTVEISTEQALAVSSDAAKYLRFQAIINTAATPVAVLVRGYNQSQNPVDLTFNSKVTETIAGPIGGVG